jgi:hypothetical protein
VGSALGVQRGVCVFSPLKLNQYNKHAFLLLLLLLLVKNPSPTKKNKLVWEGLLLVLTTVCLLHS